MFFKFLFLIVSVNAVVHDLSIYKSDDSTSYTLNKGDKVYVLSKDSGDLLKNIKITSTQAQKTMSAFDLSQVGADSTVQPYVITQDTELITISSTNSDADTATLTGIMYLNKQNTDMDLYPITDSSVIIPKHGGISVFYTLSTPANKIVAATNVQVELGSNLLGYTGFPDDKTEPTLFFNSSAFNTTTHYDILELPLSPFYFKTANDKVGYTIKISDKISNNIPSLTAAGLIMTPNYPSMTVPQPVEYNFANQNNQNGVMNIIPRFSRVKSYNTNITFYYEDGFTLRPNPEVNSYNSFYDVSMFADVPIKKIAITSEGPYAIQFASVDKSTITTTTPYIETTTKLSAVPQLIITLMPAILLRLL